MRTIIAIQLTAFLAIALTACALLPKDQLDAAKVGAGYGLTVYATAYQPILAEYARLPYCAEPAAPPCRDRALYAKLYALDGAVAQCAVAMQATLASNSPDFTAVNECVKTIERAKLAFAMKGTGQ